jgi:hypothetical protein
LICEVIISQPSNCTGTLAIRSSARITDGERSLLVPFRNQPTHPLNRTHILRLLQNSQCLPFPVQRLLHLALRLIEQRNILQRLPFSHPIPILPTEDQALLIAGERLTPFPLRLADKAQVVERPPFSYPIPILPFDNQALLIAGERLTPLPLRLVNNAQVVERATFRWPISYLPHSLQCQAIQALSFRPPTPQQQKLSQIY